MYIRSFPVTNVAKSKYMISRKSLKINLNFRRTDRAATIKALRLTKRGLLSEIASTLDGDTADDFEDIID